MDPQLILIVFFTLVLLPSGFYIYNYIIPAQNPVKNLISGNELELVTEPTATSPNETSNLRQIKRVGIKSEFNPDSITLPPLEERLFRAGLMQKHEHTFFKILQFLSPVLCVAIVLFITPPAGVIETALKVGLGLFIGVTFPRVLLEKMIEKRDEEIMYYLPLVIEQFVIGVSSGLDIGPCITRVVSVADERDTHNPVTELLKNVLFLTRSGASLDDALSEVGTLAGHTELKHSFMTMGQVSRHGGEISKQLQELANAVSSQRETKIEARVKRLELHATGPVALIFVSFMAILFVGIGLQMMKALNI